MFLTFITDAIRRYRSHRVDLHYLSRLSDRELQDIGITRYDIASTTRRSR
jgi:uncharacterized protein YjiS (DUF1127 family)